MTRKKLVSYKVVEDFSFEEVEYHVDDVVEFDSNSDEVKALLEEKKIEPVEAPEEEEGESATVTKNGNFVRSYTKEVHGKNFRKLAEEYAGKIGGKVK